MCTNWIFSAPDKWEPMSECPLDKYVDNKRCMLVATRNAGYTHGGDDGDDVVTVFSGDGTSELSETFPYLVWFQTKPYEDGLRCIWLKDLPSLVELLGKVAGFAAFWETKSVLGAIDDLVEQVESTESLIKRRI